jgi:hypothetical protein
MVSMSSTAGYSGTPLAKKLDIREGSRLYIWDGPEDYLDLVSPLPAGVRIAKGLDSNADLVHVFVTARPLLERALRTLRQTLRPEATVWVSWPKKASKVRTDVTEDVIREVALPMGWVDVKVCAVDETWSGLKLVVRRTER